MVVSIAQPSYWPWLGYFDRILKSDLHIVLDHVQFEKSWYINRNRIRCGHHWQWLTIPVKTKGLFGHSPIHQLKSDQRQNWQLKHFRTLQHHYQRTAFWHHFEPILLELYQQNWEDVRGICLATSTIVSEAIGLKTPLLSSLDLSPTEKKGALVLELCKKVGATHYLSGPFGKEYLPLHAFEEAEIQILWHDFKTPPTLAPQNPLIPPLSALDVLLEVGPDELTKHLRANPF